MIFGKKKNCLKIEDYYVLKFNKVKENLCFIFKKINSKLILKFFLFIMVFDFIICKYKCSWLKFKLCRYRFKEIVSIFVF